MDSILAIYFVLEFLLILWLLTLIKYTLAICSKLIKKICLFNVVILVKKPSTELFFILIKFGILQKKFILHWIVFLDEFTHLWAYTKAFISPLSTSIGQTLISHFCSKNNYYNFLFIFNDSVFTVYIY